MSRIPDLTVYRSSRPELIALEAKWQAVTTELCAKRDAFLAEFAPEGAGAMVCNDGINGKRMVGISMPGDGWRAADGYFIPDKRRAAGKRAATAMEAVRHNGFGKDLTGMPSLFFSDDGHMYRPGVKFHEGAIYIVWHGVGPLGTPSAGEIDLTVWEPVKLSEWYAIIEAETDG